MHKTILLFAVLCLLGCCNKIESPYAQKSTALAQEQPPKSCEVKETAKRWLRFFIDKRPHYVMSASIRPDDPIESGVDCSRYGYLVCKWSGVPVQRVTARDMAMGFGGWTGIKVSEDDADELDFFWWTWRNKPQRAYGHVGYGFILPNGLLGVTHASQTRGHIVLDKFEGKLVSDLVLIKKMVFFKCPSTISKSE